MPQYATVALLQAFQPRCLEQKAFQDPCVHSVKASLKKSLQNAFPIFKCFFRKNEKPLQDAAHALLLQKPVQESVFVA
jgi:hypothetical protein